MRVLLDETIFQQPLPPQLSLLECFALARDGRHVILHRSSIAPLVDGWVDLQAPRLQGELRAVLEQSLLLDARLTDDVPTITIIAGDQSNWRDAALCARDAVRLLREPLHILLENARNDLAFLLRLAPPDHRRDLERAIERGWAVVDQGGGLSEITHIVTDLLDPTAPRHRRFLRLKLWVMFDRDSHELNRTLPSSQSEQLWTLLEAGADDDPWPISAYRLERRAIESYLPREALWRWVFVDDEDATDLDAPQNTGADIQQRRRAAVEALAALRRDNPVAASCYNMKNGLVKDLRRPLHALKKRLTDTKQALRDDPARLALLLLDEHCDPIFRGRPDAERAALAFGFGDDIAEIYTRDDDPGFDEAFQAEYDRGGHALTREAILEQLLQRL